VRQLQVVPTSCVRPTDQSQCVVVATAKNSVPAQARYPHTSAIPSPYIPSTIPFLHIHADSFAFFALAKNSTPLF
jgi:hypothetical protein